MPNAPDAPDAPVVVSKTELMNFVAAGKGHESFEHSACGVFDITVMRELSLMLSTAGQVQKFEVPLDNICDFIRSSRDTEEARIGELAEESWRSDPGLVITMPDGTSLIIDGHHRALRREREGEQYMRFFAWPLALVDLFGRPAQNWGRPPGVEWGDPDYFAKNPKAEGENHE